MSENGRAGPKLTTKQRRFINALLVSNTIRDAAQTSAIAERTAYRWLRSEPVRSALSDALDAALSQAAARCSGAMGTALEVLLDIAEDAAAPASARVSAARAILEGGPKLREHLDLSERVTALEQKTGGAK